LKINPRQEAVHLENGEETLLLVDFLEMPAPAIPIPILVEASGAATIFDGVPEGLPVRIDALGDLGEVVQQGVPTASGAGAVVGGEAAAGGEGREGKQRRRPRGKRNGELLVREGEGWSAD